MLFSCMTGSSHLRLLHAASRGGGSLQFTVVALAAEALRNTRMADIYHASVCPRVASHSVLIGAASVPKRFSARGHFWLQPSMGQLLSPALALEALRSSAVGQYGANPV